MAKKKDSSAQTDGSEEKLTPEGVTPEDGTTEGTPTEESAATPAPDATPESTDLEETPATADAASEPELTLPEDIGISNPKTESAGDDDAPVIAQEEPFRDTDEAPTADDTPEDAETEMASDDEPVLPPSDPIETERTVAEPPLAPAGTTIVQKKGGFVPIMVGGIVAAGLGFGLALYLDNAGIAPFGSDDEAVVALTERLDAQQRVLDDLNAALEVGPDISGVEAAASEAQAAAAAASDRIAALESQLGDQAAKITELEKRPISEGVSEAAIKAYEDELARLQQAMQDQRTEVEALITQAQQKEAAAAEDAQDASIRAGISQVLSAIDNGAPYANVLQGLGANGVEIPAPLSAPAQSGVTTLGALIDTYPDAARAALADVRMATGEGTSSIGDFLKTQLGARSLTARDGDDADAVLSRAEAALRDGRLQDALAEIDTLPEPAKAAMADWTASATERAQALAAAEALLADQTQSQ
ncbi:hypothetical protein [Pseudooceanicola nanhaiensis]|uniref:hypothetical protein n=1 Tax=Pseudooceanicola nanhaiensis TaxID=375761 RepID=UPI001CD678BA|nr:hypothetical protein [Pseudooceanicola nanhaiensis]MCA0920235.1 hypothetical protein [Pseudooceanicola nanhaiensis]